MPSRQVKQILKVIVGSQAHGLATPESDFDYRGVFVLPTSEILKLGGKVSSTSWIEGKDDDTSWEIGHFLNLATHSNPTILETFLAPLVSEETDEVGLRLREIFPYVWNSNDVLNAFRGYGINQRKKMLDDKDKRGHKYAAAFLRVLYQGVQLLETGTFDVDFRNTAVYDTLVKWKSGEYYPGEVIDECHSWLALLENAYKNNPDKQTDLDAVNEFLLSVRMHHWNES